MIVRYNILHQPNNPIQFLCRTWNHYQIHLFIGNDLKSSYYVVDVLQPRNNRLSDPKAPTFNMVILSLYEHDPYRVAVEFLRNYFAEVQ